MYAARDTNRTTFKRRLSLLACSLTVVLLLLALVAGNAACTKAQPAPAKTTPSTAPAPTVAPQPSPSVKACPAYTRYNPKTGSCDKIHF